MTAAAAARLLRLYPSAWRARYGDEFAALLEEHRLSLKTFLNVLWSAGEVHMTSFNSNQSQPIARCALVWSAWMLAVPAGLILYGMVDDSPLLDAMHQNRLFGASWTAIEIGSAIAGVIIVLAGLPLAGSMLRYAVREHRRDLLLRMAFPFAAALVLLAWLIAVLACTDGRWAASPWAVAFARPEWPSESFRWITGLVSAALLTFGFAGAAVAVAQAVRRSEYPPLRIPTPGGLIELEPLRFAGWLLRWAAIGFALMLLGTVAFGWMAGHQAASAFQSHIGPLGLTAASSWMLSVILFGCAAAVSARATWRSRAA